MKVYCLIVTRNECDRYLQSCLIWHVPMFGGVLVYDDRSTDRTIDVVSASGGAAYTRRPDGVPTFMEHEGRFRQDSLEALEALFEPDEGDWVMVIDTDEFLVCDGDRAQSLLQVTTLADRAGAKSVRIPRPELWDLAPPQERVDGFWGSIQCTRLFRWEPGGRIRDMAMGCGNEPTYINTARIYTGKHSLRLLHVGYVHPDDRQEKFDRYTSLSQNGHNDSHIKSILESPRLTPWSGRMPDVWRGLR